MSIGEKLLPISKFLLARKIRGGTRLTRILANRFAPLQFHKAKVCGGVIYVDLRINGTHAYLTDETSPNDEHLVMKRFVRPGKTVYDIGANAGIFTVWLAKLVGPKGTVFSFEPNPVHQQCLAKTISLLENTELIPMGLSDREGSFDFFVPENDTMASLRDWTHGEGGRVSKTSCLVTTIDGLIAAGTISPPDFIKCDIEGGEFDCFRGGEKTIDRADAPVILFEANINSTKAYGIPVSQAMDFLASLKNARYSFYLLKPGEELDKISSIDFGHGNIVAVPASRHDRIQLPNNGS